MGNLKNVYYAKLKEEDTQRWNSANAQWHEKIDDLIDAAQHQQWHPSEIQAVKAIAERRIAWSFGRARNFAMAGELPRHTSLLTCFMDYTNPRDPHFCQLIANPEFPPLPKGDVPKCVTALYTLREFEDGETLLIFKRWE